MATLDRQHACAHAHISAPQSVFCRESDSLKSLEHNPVIPGAGVSVIVHSLSGDVCQSIIQPWYQEGRLAIWALVAFSGRTSGLVFCRRSVACHVERKLLLIQGQGELLNTGYCVRISSGKKGGGVFLLTFLFFMELCWVG